MGLQQRTNPAPVRGARPKRQKPSSKTGVTSRRVSSKAVGSSARSTRRASTIAWASRDIPVLSCN